MDKEMSFAVGVMVDSNGFVELDLTEEIVNLCYHTGDCEEEIKRCLELDEIKSQFQRIDDDTLNKSLYECTDNTKEEINQLSRNHKEELALWIACGNAVDENIFGNC